MVRYRRQNAIHICPLQQLMIVASREQICVAGNLFGKSVPPVIQVRCPHALDARQSKRILQHARPFHANADNPEPDAAAARRRPLHGMERSHKTRQRQTTGLQQRAPRNSRTHTFTRFIDVVITCWRNYVKPAPFVAYRALLQLGTGEKLQHLRLGGRLQDIAGGKLSRLRRAAFPNPVRSLHQVVVGMFQLNFRAK